MWNNRVVCTIYSAAAYKCWVKSMRRKQVIASNLIPYLACTVFSAPEPAHHRSHHHHFNQFNKLCVKCYKTINNPVKPKHRMEMQVPIILRKSQPTFYKLFGDFFGIAFNIVFNQKILYNVVAFPIINSLSFI